MRRWAPLGLDLKVGGRHSEMYSLAKRLASRTLEATGLVGGTTWWFWGGGGEGEVEDGHEEDEEDEVEEEDFADAGSSGYKDAESSIAVFRKLSSKEKGGLDEAPIVASATGSTS